MSRIPSAHNCVETMQTCSRVKQLPEELLSFSARVLISALCQILARRLTQDGHHCNPRASKKDELLRLILESRISACRHSSRKRMSFLSFRSECKSQYLGAHRPGDHGAKSKNAPQRCEKRSRSFAFFLLFSRHAQFLLCFIGSGQAVELFSYVRFTLKSIIS